MRAPRSIKARVTIATVAGFAVILLVVAALATVVVRATVQAGLADEAGRAARQVITLIDARRFDPIPPQRHVTYIQVVNDDGRVVAASHALAGRGPLTTKQPAGTDLMVEDEVCTGLRCLLVVGYRDRHNVYGGGIVYAAVQIPALLSSYIIEAGLAALSLILLGLIGWAVWNGIGRALRPVEQISAGLAAITASDLNRRIPVPPTRDEIADLAVTANQTLDRLEEGAERQRRFVSDASHELRTPITGLLTRLDLALSAPAEEDLVGTLEKALKDTERLEAIVQDLLMMARMDSGARPPEEPVDLAALISEEVARRHGRLPVKIDLAQGLVIRGNRLRLARLLTNLLSNADRYGASLVRVELRREDGEAVVVVTDDGPGIAPEDRERVFQRFTRLDSARGRDSGGTGLGLPIARDIATAHGGRLYVGSGRRGGRLILRLPLAGDGPHR